jgi:alkaline phosphatase D
VVTLGRRSLLSGAGAVAAVLPRLRPEAPAELAAPVSTLRDPFTLGVASGDPWPSSVVLWTRLAPEPLAPDGLGGMPRRQVPVEWQVAEDPAFGAVVREGQAVADPAWAHSVHVEVAGLEPGREYFYRFRAEGHLSPAGRTRTAPAAGASPPSARFAFASCANYEEGWFTAYGRLADEEPELVLHLGDYLYESPEADHAVAGERHVRGHQAGETRTLADYRRRHAQYKTDPDLQRAHAVAPWAVVFDDHEVDANWAGFHPQTPQPHFARRRAAAFRAYYEHLPLRRSSLPHGPFMPIFRRLAWGGLATVHLLDTRQYRYDQVCGDTRVIGCTAREAPGRSILGARQERWLDRGLARSGARWDLLAQQVFMAPKDSRAGPLREYAMDAWDGYAAARRRLLGSLVEQRVRNPVVLTGDVHRHYANDLLLDDATVAAELVTTSVSSGGDGSVRTALTDVQLAENPHLRWVDSRRGYVVLRLGRESLRADFRTLPYVSRPGAPVSTAASFRLGDGERGLVRTRSA